jgi:hypothetical protein
MAPRYDIFKKDSDECLIWIETVEDISQAKRRLITLTSIFPGEYCLWDPARQMFIDRELLWL